MEVVTCNPVPALFLYGRDVSRLPSHVVSRKAELIALLLADTLALVGAALLYMKARFEWLWFGATDKVVIDPLAAELTLTVFWLVVFFFFGMYAHRRFKMRQNLRFVL